MTVADLYCSRADVTKRLPLGSITSPSSIIASSIASTDVLTLDGHGLETDDEVTVRATDEGSLSTPLAPDTIYFAIRLTNATFKLAASSGGSAINITSDGASMLVTREPAYDDIIEFFSRWADTFLPAHVVPLEQPIHPLVRGIVADLSKKAILNIDGKDSASVDAAMVASSAQLTRFAAGLTLRGAPATEPATLAVSGRQTSDARDGGGCGPVGLAEGPYGPSYGFGWCPGGPGRIP